MFLSGALTIKRRWRCLSSRMRPSLLSRGNILESGVALEKHCSCSAERMHVFKLEDLCVISQASASSLRYFLEECTMFTMQESWRFISTCNILNLPSCDKMTHLWNQDWGLLHSTQCLFLHTSVNMDLCLGCVRNVPVMS